MEIKKPMSNHRLLLLDKFFNQLIHFREYFSLEFVQFRASEPLENEGIGRQVLAAIARLDADADTMNVFRAERIEYILDAVMAGRRGIIGALQAAGREVYFVVDYQQVLFRVQLIIFDYFADSFARAVHERLRLGDKNFFAALMVLADLGFEFALAGNGFFSVKEIIHGQEPRVVAGMLVLLAGISQTYD